MSILAGTGHRPSKLGDEYNLQGPVSDFLREEISKIIEKLKPEMIVSGMALGFDTLLALKALEHQIPLLAAVPFKGQENIWPQASQKKYREILEQATEIKIVSEGGYAAHKMDARNRWMTDRCTHLVAAWNGDTNGGTWNCVRYARSIGKEIIRIDPREALAFKKF